MKKIILSVATIFAFGVVSAQEVKFGAKAGLNLSNLTGDAENVSMKVGFQVGGFAEIKLSEKFALQPELMFSSLGAKNDTGGSDEALNLNYIVVPIMAKYFATEKLSFEAGPSVGILMSAKFDSEDVKDIYNSTDFGVNFGAGFDVTENINLGLRYTLGLGNIVKDSDDYKVGNSNIAFTFGYKF